jgi:hypothetical protein
VGILFDAFRVGLCRRERMSLVLVVLVDVLEEREGVGDGGDEVVDMSTLTRTCFGYVAKNALAWVEASINAGRSCTEVCSSTCRIISPGRCLKR